MRTLFFTTACALVISLSASTIAYAGASDLFTKLDGKFRGSGTSIVGSKNKKVRISCQLTNSYDKAAGKLKMTGKCASSQGSRKVNGTITHAGNKVTGTYISLRSSIKITRTSGKIGSNSVSVFASYVDENSGNLGKIRQVIQLKGSGFQANFFAFDNKVKKYKPVGVISFKRK